MNKDVTIALADDQHLFRKGIITVINSFAGMQVVLEATNGRELLSLLNKNKLPDVVILDLKMPEMDGIETTKALSKQFSGIKIIILTIYNEERFISHLLECGAHAYILKDSDPDEFEKAIRAVSKDGFYFTEKIFELLKKNTHKRKRTISLSDVANEFSSREIEILNLICKEYTAEEIGEKLFISARTVEGHRNRMLVKAGCKNVAGLVVFAIRNRLIEIL